MIEDLILFMKREIVIENSTKDTKELEERYIDSVVDD